VSLAGALIREETESFEYLRTLVELHAASAELKAAYEARDQARIREAMDRWAAATATADMIKGRLDAKDRIRACDHQWASMINKVIASGKWCPKCGALKP